MLTTSSFTIQCPAPGNLQAFAVSGSGTNADYVESDC